MVRPNTAKQPGPAQAADGTGVSGAAKGRGGASGGEARALMDAAGGGIQVDKASLGTPPNGASMAISPADQHVAWAAFQGSRSTIVVDGAAGPAFDTLLPSPETAVVFSDDGGHYAYLGRNGDQVSMVVDGKVIGRTPYNQMAIYKSLTFGPHGHHVYFMDAFDYSGQGGYRIVMDGVPGPTHAQQSVGFSPDGEHYAYSVEDRASGGYIILDGKRKSVGGTFSFGADGRIVDIAPTAHGQSLSVDGRTLLTAYRIGDVHTSRRGQHVVAQITPAERSGPELWVDGRIVARPCEDLKSVAFSGDGKRYVAVCAAATGDRAFAVVDGHKGREYFTIGESPGRDSPKFTADGAHVIYEALVQRGGSDLLTFVVVDGKELGPYKYLRSSGRVGDQDEGGIATSKIGSGYAFIADQYAGPDQVLVWNGRELPLTGVNGVDKAPTMSDTGDHVVFAATKRSVRGGELIFRDGQAMPGVLSLEFARLRQRRSLPFALSPDGNHLVYANVTKGGRRQDFYLDDRPLFGSRGDLHMTEAAFTPDSRHLFSIVNSGWQHPQRLLIDDKHVLDLPPPGPFDDKNASDAWQMNADGSLQFLTKEPGGSVVRYRIAPAGGKS